MYYIMEDVLNYEVELKKENLDTSVLTTTTRYRNYYAVIKCKGFLIPNFLSRETPRIWSALVSCQVLHYRCQVSPVTPKPGAEIVREGSPPTTYYVSHVM